MNLKIISAGAGSGKTYRLTSEMVELLQSGVRASGIIATTFTRKAAAELQERVRVRLLRAGLHQAAEELSNALVGTVHSLGVKLLQRFAYEAGVSPAVSIIAEEDQRVLFNQSLATVLTEERVNHLTALAQRLGLSDNEKFDWRDEVRRLTEVARANDFSADQLALSKERSCATFRELLAAPGTAGRSAQEWNAALEQVLQETAQLLAASDDTTKVTREAHTLLTDLARELRLRGELSWRDWARLTKLAVGAKSRHHLEPLLALVQHHDEHPAFLADVEAFIEAIFDLATAAMSEYERYKQLRGLIDYTDMEVLIKRLLAHPQVEAVLREELDLLLVDEFQDTSPIQLEIFLRLTQLAKHAIWVGDPKQSIYGFRGADPALMQAIIRHNGGIRPADIQRFSWRSRQDLVEAVNAVFTKAFADLPPEQVALEAKRLRTEDHPAMGLALHHWQLAFDPGEDGGRSRQPGKPWLEESIAFALRTWLERGVMIRPKDGNDFRRAVPGDVAILCRSNQECQAVAAALHQAGFQAAIARAGLLHTAEAKLVLAGLKYLLNHYDSLSIAEILLLGEGLAIEDIIEDRLEYLEAQDAGGAYRRWAAEQPVIQRLDQLRQMAVELSSAEVLDLLLEELDLRRKVAQRGNPQQRLDNLEVLRSLARQFEEGCNRLHAAASLGGFLLWLGELANQNQDYQAAGERPDAVNVLTYHKSKGLEWPIVICHSLEKEFRAEVWGIHLVPETAEVDLNNVLGNRWLRYWVNPYGKQLGKTPLANAVASSAAQQRQTALAMEEENRLLYVGMTRARDYLIFPSSQQPTRWLNRSWQSGAEEQPTLLPDQTESPWEWAGRIIPLHPETFTFGRHFERQDSPVEPLFFWELRAGRQDHPALDWQVELRQHPERWSGPAGQLGNTWHYLAEPRSEVDPAAAYPMAKAIKAFLAALDPNEPVEQAQALAEGLLERFGVATALSAATLLAQGQAWHQFQQLRFQPLHAWRKFPLRLEYDQRQFETIIDLILQGSQHLALVQNSGFAGDLPRCKQKALQLSAYLFLAKKASEHQFPGQPVRTYVHFVLQGLLVEVDHHFAAPELPFFRPTTGP